MDVLFNTIFAMACLALVSAGLVVIFGLMKVINFAHGEFMMLGAFTTLWLSGVVGFWAAVALATLLLGVAGALTERVLIRRLYRRPLDTILATYGLAIVIRESMGAFGGHEYRSVLPPLRGPVTVAGITVDPYRIVVIALAVTLLVALWWVERRTSVGRLVRAVMENPGLARSLGVSVDRVYATTFAIGSALAGLAGCLMAPLVTISPSLGAGFLINAFLTAVVAGGSLLGVGAAAGILGGTQNLATTYIDPISGNIVLLIVAVLVMRVRSSRLWVTR